MTRQLTLADLIQGFGGQRPAGYDLPVTPVIDSRTATPGSVFFAFQGERVDGHAYVGDAFARGAAAAVIEHDVDAAGHVVDLTQEMTPGEIPGMPLLIRVPDVLKAMQQAATWWRRNLSPRVIGITGSVGKTTTKEVVARVLGRRHSVLRNTGSRNNEIGLPLTLLGMTDEYDRLVLEMGMYVRGDIRFLAGIALPDIGIVTNVEAVHAERAGTIDDIALGKRELIEALPSDGAAILNFDDQRVRAMAHCTSARVVTYGLDPAADLWADQVEGLGLSGIRLRMHHGDEVISMTTPMLGRHSVYAILRAAAVGLVDGLGWPDIIEGINAVDTQLRLKVVDGPDGSLIIDDTYNSSPPSALAALDFLGDLDGRKIAVLGDMLELGDYAREGHLQVGHRAAEVVSELVAVGPLAVMIAKGAEDYGLSRTRIHLAPDSTAAAPLVRDLVRPRDVILVKGSHSLRMEVVVEELTRKVA